jgi:hypothetical protein
MSGSLLWAKTSRKEVCDMTSQQINYWKVLNDMESVSNEKARTAETVRHNIVTEGETQRHNEAGERLEAWSISEASRHNQAYEAETRRHNEESERLTQRSQYIGIQDLKVNQARAKSQIAVDQSNIALNQAKTEVEQHNVSYTDVRKFESGTRGVMNIFSPFLNAAGGASAAAGLIVAG